MITPYTRQVKQIVDQLSNLKIPQGVEVRTVDGFQGREKKIILISTVRSNDENEIGFLNSQQRMNVLLTRAQHAMIVFGNRTTLSSDHLWRSWISSVPTISSTNFISTCLKKSEEHRQTKSNHRRRK